MSTIAATPCLPTFEFLEESGAASVPSELLPLAETVTDAVGRMLTQFPPGANLDEDSMRQLTGNILRALAAEAFAGRLRYGTTSMPAATVGTPTSLES